MRNKLLILISLPIFFQLGISCCSTSEYKIENGKIFWKQDLKVKKELKDVDLETFEDLDGSVKLNAHFAKDKNNIYYQGVRLEGADLKSFEILGGFYSKDKNSVFYREEKVHKVNPRTFVVPY